jgi:hypothetical protein
MDRQPLLQGRNVTLRSKHTERPGIERHRLNDGRGHHEGAAASGKRIVNAAVNAESE